jgi:hypothetical protein
MITPVHDNVSIEELALEYLELLKESKLPWNMMWGAPFTEIRDKLTEYEQRIMRRIGRKNFEELIKRMHQIRKIMGIDS